MLQPLGATNGATSSSINWNHQRNTIPELSICKFIQQVYREKCTTDETRDRFLLPGQCRQKTGWRLNKICHRCFSQPENQSLDSTDALCTSTQNWLMVLLWGLFKGLLGNSYTIKMTTEKNFPNTLCEGRLIMSEKDKCNTCHITGYRTHTTVEWSDVKVQSNNNLNRITPTFVNVAQFIVSICSFYLHISSTTEARQVREESSQPSFH